MARRWAPGITTAQRTTVTPTEREFLYDTDEDRPYFGDGSTAGARALAYKSEVDALPVGSEASSAVVTSTGGSESIALADRFSDVGLPWVNVRDFGALGDVVYNASGAFVSGTDDTPAIQAAIDYIEATAQGRGIVFFPRGFYLITGTLRIKKGIKLVGAGGGHWHDHTAAVPIAVKDAASALCWHNASGDKVLHVEPAVANGRRISGFGICGLAIYGHYQATHGIYARSVNGIEGECYIEGTTGPACYMGVVPSADGIVAEARDSQLTFGFQLRARNTGATGGALFVADGDATANTSKMRMTVLGLYLDAVGNGAAIDCINSDNMEMVDCVIYRLPGGTARPVILRAGATANVRARAMKFKNLSAQAADGAGHEPLVEGFTYAAVPSTGNYFELDSGNQTPVPIVDAGATCVISDHTGHDIYGDEHYNLIINGDFAHNMLAPASSADKTPGHQGWVVLTEANPIAVSTQSGQFNGVPTNARLTQSNASAQRMGYLGVIESKDATPYRGGGVALALRARMSVTGNLHVAIVEHTGTADAFPADIVNNWGSTDYTTGNFFTSSNLNVLSHFVTAMSAATWKIVTGAIGEGTCRGLTGKVGNSATNLGVLIWPEDQLAQNVTLDIGRVRMAPGYEPRLTLWEDYATTLERCERQVFKTYNLPTAPAASTVVGAANHNAAGGAQASRWWVPFRTRMLTTPSVTVYSTTGASGNVRDLTAGADKTAGSSSAGETGVTINPTENLTDNNIHGFHVVATAYPWL